MTDSGDAESGKDLQEPARIYRCPQCRKPVQWRADNPFRPFCSERCKLIDLGDWAAERHSIPGEIPGIEGLDWEDET